MQGAANSTRMPDEALALTRRIGDDIRRGTYHKLTHVWQTRVTDPTNLARESDRAVCLVDTFSVDGHAELLEAARYSAMVLSLYDEGLPTEVRAEVDAIKTASDVVNYLLRNTLFYLCQNDTLFSAENKAAMLAYDPAWCVYFDHVFTACAALSNTEAATPGLQKAAAVVTALYDHPAQRYLALQQWLQTPCGPHKAIVCPATLPEMD